MKKIFLVATLLLTGCFLNQQPNEEFSMNLECEKLKDSIQFNSDNYSANSGVIISKVQKVFYSPKARKCLYVSVSAIDLNAPNDLIALTEKDYQHGARWKLRTISGELIEDLLTRVTDEPLYVLGLKPQHEGSYEDFVKLQKEWE